MEFIANILSNLAISASSENRCAWFFYDEPTYPKELLK